MFGMGMGELLVVLVVALLFLGPAKLPEAAKAIGRGIRELRRHTRDLEETLEQDEQIGGTVRELKSVLRGDLTPARAGPRRQVERPDAGAPGEAGASAAPAAAPGAPGEADAPAGTPETPAAPLAAPAGAPPALADAPPAPAASPASRDAGEGGPGVPNG